VAIGATDVVAAVLASAIVVVLFPAAVTLEAGFGYLLRALALERVYLGLVAAAGHVLLPGTVTRFATLLVRGPIGQVGELGVRGLSERVELVLVTTSTGFGPDIVTGGLCAVDAGRRV
jgi:hypothetical protein